MSVYYNESDPFAAAWLRELMKDGVIPEGRVDERSIEDVTPDDVRGFTQCHWFAGVGVWAYALRLAGWPADRPVWTGSCPCQPFSPAGKGKAFADERHLWPAFFHHVSQLRPVVVFGEQVEGKDGLAWIDLVQDDLESCGYTVGTVVAPAAGFGSPQGRHRLYWVADADGGRRERAHLQLLARRPGETEPDAGRGRGNGALDHADSGRGHCGGTRDQEGHGGGRILATDSGIPRPVADADRRRRGAGRDAGAGERPEDEPRGLRAVGGLGDAERAGLQVGVRPGELGAGGPGPAALAAGPANGLWGDAVWIPCRDGKWRAVEPCLVPVADGPAGDLGLVRLANYPDRPHEERVVYAPLIKAGKARGGRIRGYGNALCLAQAVAFVESFLEVERGIK